MRAPAGPRAATRSSRSRPGFTWRRRVGRMVAATGIALALLLGLIAAGGILLLHRYSSALSTGTLLAPDARSARHGPVAGPLNVLLIGSDYRTWSPSAGQRSDTIIIAHVTQALDHVYLISIPRDLLVTIPADPQSGYGGGSAKINSAFDAGHGGEAGIQLLSRTLTDLADIRFDGAVSVQFDGLKKAVDLLGGVRLCVDVRTVSIHTGKVYDIGCRLMNSTEALDYLRQRQFADGDFTRQRHQQQFLKALLDRARGTGVTSNPVRLDEFLRAVAGALTVDTGDASLPDVAFALRGLQTTNITGLKVPTTNDTISGVSYVVATPDADGLFTAIRSDTLDQWTHQHPQWVNAT